MIVTVGTFNLNNLFSRFNFAGAISALQSPGSSGAMTIRYEFTDADHYRVRTFRGALVQAKDADDTAKISQRIIDMNVDVLAVQEVENIEILKEFNREQLGGMYPYQVLHEGNDIRFIDIGLLSKLPVGAITSHQAAVHPESPDTPVFSRDLLEVEILDPGRKRKLFTIFNNHLKSHFGDHENGGLGKIRNDTRRRQQAESVARIVAARMRRDARYIIAGDMNDAPDAEPLDALNSIEGNAMVNGLAEPVETRSAKTESGGHDPLTSSWTHRFKPSGKPPRHELYDQIWLSPALKDSLHGSFIDRRKTHGGDGSDHDPAWVELDV